MANRGIVLLNLGSPDSTEVKDVRHYLMEFLMDERVIDYPYLLRLLLVGGIIVPFRAAKSAEAYKKIWTKEGSPLIVLTEKLKEALQPKIEEPVEIAMRYCNPSMQLAFENLLAKSPQLEEVVAIPLYPQFAMSSYETAVEHAKAVHKKNRYPFKLSFIKPFYNDQDYISALADSIKPHLNQEYDKILFSYHGIPKRHLTKADPTGNHCLKSGDCCQTASVAHATCYRHQCFSSTRLVTRALNIPDNKFEISFQSRLGKEEWIKPYTAERLEQLPKEGVKKLLVVCPAFVSDCLETIEEINMEGRKSFLESGGESFDMIPCLNVHPEWINAIVGWLAGIRNGKTEMLLD